MDPLVHRRAQLLAAGFSPKELRRLLRTGELSAVRPGAYVQGTPPDDTVGWHLLLVHAALDELAADAVVSHVSAAVLHGLPVWGIPLERVHVTRGSRSGGRRGRRVHVHAAPLESDEIAMAGELAVTSPARTLVDLARVLPFEQAVAGRRRGAPPPSRRPVGSRCRAGPQTSMAGPACGAPGPRLRRRPQRERGGVAQPGRDRLGRSAGSGAPVGGEELGRPIRRASGLRLARPADGRGVRRPRQVRRAGAAGQDPAEVRYREKLGEDELRAQDLAVVRWGWVDLDAFAAVAERLRRRFRNG